MLIGFGVFVVSSLSIIARFFGANSCSFQILLMFFVLLVAIDVTKEDKKTSEKSFLVSNEQSYRG